MLLALLRWFHGLVGIWGLSIVLLTGCAFFLPAAVLTSVSPMAAKLRLGTLDETGAVVGGLSAAGTIGALLITLVILFSLKGETITENPLTILWIAVPLFLQTLLIFGLGYGLSKLLKLRYTDAAPSALEAAGIESSATALVEQALRGRL